MRTKLKYALNGDKSFTLTIDEVPQPKIYRIAPNSSSMIKVMSETVGTHEQIS